MALILPIMRARGVHTCLGLVLCAGFASLALGGLSSDPVEATPLGLWARGDGKGAGQDRTL